RATRSPRRLSPASSRASSIPASGGSTASCASTTCPRTWSPTSSSSRSVRSLDETLREGVEALRHGNLAKGMAHLFAVRQHVPADEAGRLVQQRATLGFAIAARNQGKHRLARQIVEDLLLEPPDPS